MKRRTPVPLLILLVFAACGDVDAPVEPAAQPVDGSVEAWDTIPFESLYGVPAEENVRVVRLAMDLPSLPPQWDGLKVAVISDFQLGLWEENEEVAAAAVRRALQEEPNAVLLLGDFIARGENTEALSRVIAPLRERATYAVLGDRDLRSDSAAARVQRVLQRHGVTVLRNSVAPLAYGGATANIGGVDADLAEMSWGDQEWILASLGDGASTPILLSHIPGVVPRIPEARFAAAFAGGTVCGDVEVPGTPRLSWLRENVLPGAGVSGHDRVFIVERTPLFVTCGIGHSFLPARFSAPPEIVIATLRTGAAQSAETAEADTADAAADSLLNQYEQADTAG